MAIYSIVTSPDFFVSERRLGSLWPLLRIMPQLRAETSFGRAICPEGNDLS
jgi:hypothetical protein